MKQVMQEYLEYATEQSKDDAALLAKFCQKGARNLKAYSQDFFDNQIAFIVSQLKSWCDGKAFEEFEKLIK